MKISVITAVYNRSKTIGDALECVLNQDAVDVESVVIDGMSDDGTDQVISRYKDRISVHVREPDKGIYDALNKGFSRASGDVIGFLHADDMLNGSTCLSTIDSVFQDPSVDLVYGDLIYVGQQETSKVVRYWKDRVYDRRRFRFGWMPAHPTVYVRRGVYEKFGLFRDDFHTSADYECLVRLLYKHELKAVHIPETLVKMRVGGQSNATLANRRRANQEDRLAWVVNGLKPPPLLRLSKPMRKLPQYFTKPST